MHIQSVAWEYSYPIWRQPQHCAHSQPWHRPSQRLSCWGCPRNHQATSWCSLVMIIRHSPIPTSCLNALWYTSSMLCTRYLPCQLLLTSFNRYITCHVYEQHSVNISPVMYIVHHLHIHVCMCACSCGNVVWLVWLRIYRAHVPLDVLLWQCS